jgi:heme exporter protein C
MPNSVQASTARASAPAVAAAPPVETASGSRAPSVIRWLTIGAAALLMVELYLIFIHAPVEKQMGIVQKIFYFHVPSAYGMYIGFIVSAIASAMYLAKRQDRWDAWAVAGAEVGSIFCLIMLITGPLWGRKAWGTYWTWDPRLTTTLLAGMVYFAYIVLRSFGSTGEVEKRFAAGLAIFGVLDIPIIHYSVQRWRGTHPTVITGKGGGLHPDMYPALFVGFALFTVLGVLLMWQRARVEGLRQRALALEIEAAERGLLEES